MKKRGFGVNRWNGIGGKVDREELIEDAVRREIQEEIGVAAFTFHQIGTLNFYFPHNPDWDQQVLVFIVTEWRGEPTESEEMKPQWFEKNMNAIPLKDMWPDDKYWLPLILEGKKVEGEFLFGENDTVLDYSTEVIN